MKNGQNVFWNASANIATPPIRCSTASSFSVDSRRSAIWPPKYRPNTHAIACVAKIQPISPPVNPSTSPRYSASSGSHDPQIRYSRNIITERRVEAAVMIGGAL